MSWSRALLLLLALGFSVSAFAAVLRRPSHIPHEAWADRAKGRTLLVWLAAACAIVFAELAAGMLRHRVEPYDRAIALAVHSVDGPVSDVVMRLLTAAGEPEAVVAVAAAVATWAWHRGHARSTAVVACVALSTEMLNFLLKHAFERARPTLFVEIATLHSYSFPSGHAMASAAVYGSAALVASRLKPSLARPLAWLTPPLVFGIGLSRVFLGVHWPTDVAAGFACGLLMCVATALALDAWAERPHRVTLASVPGLPRLARRRRAEPRSRAAAVGAAPPDERGRSAVHDPRALALRGPGHGGRR